MTSLFDGSLEHVYYLAYIPGPPVGFFHVYELYYNGAWWGNDLTAAPNAANPFKGLTSLFDGMQHVFYIGETLDPYTNQKAWGHVYELYYNGAWHVNDLTKETHGPAALSGNFGGVGIPNPITSLVTP